MPICQNYLNKFPADYDALQLYCHERKSWHFLCIDNKNTASRGTFVCQIYTVLTVLFRDGMEPPRINSSIPKSFSPDPIVVNEERE